MLIKIFVVVNVNKEVVYDIDLFMFKEIVVQANVIKVGDSIINGNRVSFHYVLV